jgi:hypothetical protein
MTASLLIPLYAFCFPVMSPLDNPCSSAQVRHIFPLLLTNDPHSLIQRLPDLRLLLLQFFVPLAFLQAPQVFPTWLTRLPQFLIHLLPLPAILMTGGQEMTKRSVNDTRRGRRSRPVIGLLFNQLSAYLFAFSGIRFDRIVNQGYQ